MLIFDLKLVIEDVEQLTLLIGFLHCLCTVHCISTWLIAECEPEAARFEEMEADFCVFKSNAPCLKLYFYKPMSVDMPTLHD